jgi:hypothetical protein
MSTKRSAGPGVPAAAHENDSAAVKPKKARSPNLCTFTFADGRQCRTPRCSGHLHLCYFHAQKEAESLAAQQVGEDISRFLPTKLLTACDLGVAMSRLFCAVARGEVKPKVAATLAYLAQTMLQSIPIAQHEYCEALGPDYWCGAIRSSFKIPPPEPEPAPKPQRARPVSPPVTKPTTQPPQSIPQRAHPASPPASAPRPSPQSTPQPAQATATSTVCHSERLVRGESASSSNSSLATHHSFTPSAAEGPLPQPLPPTSAEFARQVLAGRNSTRSETPAPSGPGRETGSSGSSSSSSSSAAPQPPMNCHSERSAPSAFRKNLRNEEPASSSNSSLATHHSFTPSEAEGPLPQVRPGFGAPANWDVLIPPKPRRRFSRHWHLVE